MARNSKNNMRIRGVLVAHFPGCFLPPHTPKRPLKIGVFEEVLSFFPALNEKHLRRALADYTSGPSYQAMMLEGAPRYDLNGDISGFVTPEQAAHASKKMETLSEEARSLWADILAVQQCLAAE